VRRGRGERGQATAELALVTPLAVLLLLCVVQVGLVARDQILVTHAARAGARAAAVDPRPAVAAAAARSSGDLASERMTVHTGQSRGDVTVMVTYHAPTSVPLIGAILGDVELRASSTFRVER